MEKLRAKSSLVEAIETILGIALLVFTVVHPDRLMRALAAAAFVLVGIVSAADDRGGL